MRAFVIGNGQSLRNTPLERLAGEVTFATNRIHLIYEFTNWRPKFYVRTEPPGGGDPDSFFAECRTHVAAGELCIFPEGWRESLGIADCIEYIQTCRHFKYPPPHKKAHFTWHLPVICDTSVVTAAIQIAVLKGFAPIYLLGCDLSGAHFSEQDTGEIQSETWRIEHEIARKCSPVPIYNATLGGTLEVYERVDLEDVLHGPQ